jgi:hypothetical protein
MTPLGPLLSIRPASLDESSPSDQPQAASVGGRAALDTLEVGQFVDARIVALETGGALAQIGASLLHLNFAGPLTAGQDVRLQLLDKEDQLEFRIADVIEAQQSSLSELSGAHPLLVGADPNTQHAASRAPAGWPLAASPAEIAALSNQDLVQLLENGVRGLLTGRIEDAPLAAASEPGSSTTNAASPTHLDNPAAAASPQATTAATPLDPRLLAFVGWAWPDQAIEIEVDRRAKNPAMSEYMRSCTVSLRLSLPVSGRIRGLLSSSTAGLSIDLEVEREDTAIKMRSESGDFLDLMKSLEMRVTSMVVRHV